MKKFEARLYCYNCGKYSGYYFPYETVIQRGSYGSGTTVRVPQDKAPGWVSEKITCPKCGSDRVG